MLLGLQTDFSKAEAYFLQRRREVTIRRSKKLKRKKRDWSGKESKTGGGRQKEAFLRRGATVEIRPAFMVFEK
jgi:hypothetical protein